jgi:hypothetical protein
VARVGAAEGLVTDHDFKPTHGRVTVTRRGKRWFVFVANWPIKHPVLCLDFPTRARAEAEARLHGYEVVKPKNKRRHSRA